MRKTTALSWLIVVALIALLVPSGCVKSGDTPTNPVIPIDSTEDPVIFTNVPDASDVIMYEVNLRAISDAGTFQGVTDRLDELKALNINVLWLMPIYPIGEINSVNSPYCVKNYKALNSEYGPLSSFDRLVSEAHSRDMAVILDWVANHTAWDNPWIANRDWYTQDASGNIIHPPGTNWQDVADLNFDNQEMRAAMIEAMKFWVTEENIDGFRCDYADGVPYDFWKQAIDSLRLIENRKILMLAEGNRSDHFTAGFDMNYAWDFYGAIVSVFNGTTATKVFDVNTSEYAQIPAGKEKLRFTTNHDYSAWENTPMELFNGEDGALTASAITIFLGGSPMIYTGQEVGRENTVSFFYNDPIDWTTHPDMLNHYQKYLTCYAGSDAARNGNLISYANSNVVCFERTLGNERLAVIANVRNQTVSFTVPDELQGVSWTNVVTGTSMTPGTTLSLAAYESYVLQIK